MAVLGEEMPYWRSIKFRFNRRKRAGFKGGGQLTTPAHNIGAASSELKASGIGVT